MHVNAKLLFIYLHYTSFNYFVYLWILSEKFLPWTVLDLEASSRIYDKCLWDLKQIYKPKISVYKNCQSVCLCDETRRNNVVFAVSHCLAVEKTHTTTRRGMWFKIRKPTRKTWLLPCLVPTDPTHLHKSHYKSNNIFNLSIKCFLDVQNSINKLNQFHKQKLNSNISAKPSISPSRRSYNLIDDSASYERKKNTMIHGIKHQLA